MEQTPRWILGLCSVLFDVDVGPKVEDLVPEDALTAEEKQDVAFHAFPDSMSLELHARHTIRDSCFFFRVKRRGMSLQNADRLRSSEQSALTSFPSTSDRYIYGFVFCRQRQDASLRRGGEQLSVLVLSEHPFSSVLRPLSQAAGQMFFSHGKPALMQLHEEVSCWPAPVAGPLLQLQAGHTNIQARLPSMRTLPHPSALAEMHSRYPSIDSMQSQLDRAVDAVLAEDAVAAASSSGSGPPSGGNAQNSPPRKPVRSLHRVGSMPARPSRSSQFVRSSMSANSIVKGGSTEEAMPSGLVPLQGQTSIDSVGESAAVSAAAAVDAGTECTVTEAGDAASGAGVSGWNTNVQRRPSIATESSSAVQGAFCEVDVYTSLHSHLPRLWQLWEMVLLAKPLIIVGLSPADSCNAVAALISLVAPLPFRPDFRPYFTIHDTSFQALSSGQMPNEQQPDSLPLLIGVTNPYFIKALSHWPSVLSVGRKEYSAWSGANTGNASAAVLNPGAAIKALTQRMRGAQSLLTTHSESLWTSYRPLIRPDDVLLARLLKPQAGDVRSKLARLAVVNNEALRRHFQELTAAFLSPFSRFFEPGPNGVVPRWDAAAFLSSLPTVVQSPVLLDRFSRPSDLAELYSRFVTSANFCFWMDQRQQRIAHLLAPEPLSVALALSPGGKPMEEVELIGMFFESEMKLQEFEAKVKSSEDPRDSNLEITRLKRQLAGLFLGMPEDLQWTCISSPARRQMLASLQAELNSDQQQQLQRLVARLK